MKKLRNSSVMWTRITHIIDYSEKISAERLFTLLEKGKIGQMKEEFDKLKQLADIDENGMLNYRELAKKFLKEKDNI